MEFELGNHEYIELNKLLKILNLVESGGQANMMIKEEEVLLNGELETRKRKKLFKGDVIEFMGDRVEIV